MKKQVQGNKDMESDRVKFWLQYVESEASEGGLGAERANHEGLLGL
jgi:hypothetical protein